MQFCISSRHLLLLRVARALSDHPPLLFSDVVNVAARHKARPDGYCSIEWNDACFTPAGLLNGRMTANTNSTAAICANPRFGLLVFGEMIRQ